jgi:hypothetical protein
VSPPQSRPQGPPPQYRPLLRYVIRDSILHCVGYAALGVLGGVVPSRAIVAAMW